MLYAVTIPINGYIEYYIGDTTIKTMLTEGSKITVNVEACSETEAIDKLLASTTEPLIFDNYMIKHGYVLDRTKISVEDITPE
ncbi:hypothetical protein ELBI_26 [Anabaena phage Elbi]|nr:hypothetical protein ELBI_26 [Anabaena phage Elbi]